MGKNHLDKAKSIKDNEFYTLAEDVKKIFDIIPNKHEYHYILPFNDVNSEFKKYCEQNNLDYSAGTMDYREYEYNIPNALVVSNPPFSMINEIVDFYIRFDIKFILVIPKQALVYKNVFKYWKQWKINPLYVRMDWVKSPDGSKKNIQCYLITNLPTYHFSKTEAGNLNQDLFWTPKRLAKTEYHMFNDTDVYVDKMGADFKNLIHGVNGYKTIYLPITAILTLPVNANRHKCFFNNGVLLENGKKSYKKIVIINEEE